MGSYKIKLENLIKYSIDTLTNSAIEDVQTNARKSLEAFCKIMIFHHYGEERGRAIIYAQDEEWNKKLGVNSRQKKRGFDLMLGSLTFVVLEVSMMESCYDEKYQEKELSNVAHAKREWFKKRLELLTFGGNNSAHESALIEMDSDDVIITQKILTQLLRWLFKEFLKCETPDELFLYIGKFDIFLSYRHTDVEWIEILKKNLESQGYTLFVDSYQMIGGEKIKERLKNAIEKSSCGIVVYPVERDFQWIEDEIAWMKEKQKRDSSFKIIPVVMHTTEYLFDEEINYVDFRETEYNQAFNQLICSIKGVTPSKIYIKGELKQPLGKNESLVKMLFTNLSRANAVPQMVIASKGVNRLWYINAIKAQAKKQYHQIYHIALPTDDMSDKKYFRQIANVFEIEKSQANKVKSKLIKLIKNADEKVFILVTDFENDKHLNDFAKIMRAVLESVGEKLRLITIGGEKLANLRTNMGVNSYFNYFEQHYI